MNCVYITIIIVLWASEHLFVCCSFQILSPNKARKYLLETGHRYSTESILQSELRILKTLHFCVSVPSPLVYLETLLEALGKICVFLWNKYKIVLHWTSELPCQLKFHIDIFLSTYVPDYQKKSSLILLEYLICCYLKL